MTVNNFTWNELMSTDVQGSMDFYTALIGWKTQAQDMGTFTYNMLMASDKAVGGVVPFASSEEVPLPSHWVPYLEVKDVDAFTERAKTLGGEVCVPPTDIPGVGRFSLVQDPQGAIFSPMTSSSAAEAIGDTDPGPGQSCWIELMTNDVDGAKAFYSELVGWSFDTMDMGGTPYTLAKEGERMVAGVMTPSEMFAGRPSWVTYTVVENIDGAAEKTVELGGKVAVPPVPLPSGGRMAIIIDPTGGVLGLWAKA
mgnify:CR=1 FL=1